MIKGYQATEWTYLGLAMPAIQGGVTKVIRRPYVSLCYEFNLHIRNDSVGIDLRPRPLSNPMLVYQQ